jgi:rhomboid family GlyGly-CTERM serine protease
MNTLDAHFLPALASSGNLPRAKRATQQWSLSDLPIVTALVAILAVAASTSVEWTSLLTYDRLRLAAGESWRLITGHLVHWNLDHLLWDGIMFAALGAMVERQSRRGFVATVAISAVAVAAAVWMFEPAMTEYRGLSGVDSALFGLAAPMLFCESRRNRRHVVSWIVAALALGFVGKVGWEMATGQTLFVDSVAAGFAPLPLVHAVGAAVGLGVWFCCRKQQTTSTTQSVQTSTSVGEE